MGRRKARDHQLGEQRTCHVNHPVDRKHRTAIVLVQEAAMFVDGRYTLQVADQVDKQPERHALMVCREA